MTGLCAAERMAGRKTSWSAPLWMGGLLIWLWGLGWLTAWKVMSYATGQDPRIYLHFAEAIRADGYSLEAIARCTRWVVPGYPLLLAAVLDGLGIFAAYWINLPIFFVFIWLLIIVLRRFASPTEIGLTLLLFFWIVVTGHPLNPHYLFLPFRGLIEWTWMLGGLVIALPGTDPGASDRFRYRRAAGTALWLMGGVLFRETILFILPPLGLIWLWQGVRGNRGAWKALAALMGPPILAFLVFLAWKWARQEPLMNSQVKMWVTGLLRGGFAKPFPLLLADILRLMGAELRAVGLIGLAAGTGWAVVRREKTVFILAVTAGLLVLFYAVYKSHVRYTLSALGLVALIAGWGGAVTLTWVARRLSPRWRIALNAAVMLLVTAFILRAIAAIDTWGPRISPQDVMALQRHPLAAEPVVFVEKDNRHLVDALVAFTSAEPKDPVLEGAAITTFEGAFFMRPLDDKGRTAIQQGVSAENGLKQYVDIVPFGDEIMLGDTRLQVCRLAAWSQRQVVFDLAMAPGQAAGVLWLDFKAGVAADSVQVDLRVGTEIQPPIVLHQPAGLLPVWVQAGVQQATNLHVEIRSPVPLPADVEPVFVPTGGVRWLTMEAGRLPSVRGLLGEGFEDQPPQAKHGAAWRERAEIDLPALAGPAPATVQVAVTLRLLPRPVSDATLQGSLARLEESTAATKWQIPAGRGEGRATWKGHGAGPVPPLVLTAEPWPADCWYLRVERIGISFTATAEPG
ncbi:MAG: hypothetical protein PHO14_05865 [Kiritimatiellae bacterium]|jgi:hypothetical protein|nr:hypothetical protein [Kiritimatiellia bacterium]MDD4341744.1 hypothetical protein [Kiritimatiellia bacterium]MDY0148840.1 hypothetical protein [Kiritimatiellia bacterium]